jgi:hypothetical protein
MAILLRQHCCVHMATLLVICQHCCAIWHVEHCCVHMPTLLRQMAIMVRAALWVFSLERIEGLLQKIKQQ